MTDFGPFARWPDPRAYDLIAAYRWGDFQRALLLGQESWDRTGMTTYQARAYDGMVECLTERGFRIVRSPDHTGDVVTIEADLPPPNEHLDAFIDQWRLRMEGIRILALDGPVERVGEHQVPIFEAATFGEIEVRGTRVFGIQPRVFIVGRIDVRQIETLDLGGGQAVTKVPLGTTHASRVRTTLRRARNTAAMVDAAIPGLGRARGAAGPRGGGAAPGRGARALGGRAGRRGPGGVHALTPERRGGRDYAARHKSASEARNYAERHNR